VRNKKQSVALFDHLVYLPPRICIIFRPAVSPLQTNRSVVLRQNAAALRNFKNPPAHHCF